MWLPIFKTGKWTDSSGQTKEWTKEDLDKIVEKYNPKEHEAPVVIGHPKDNAPAWGWVEKLKRDGEMLYAKLKDVVPEFKEWVKKGLYKKRSISLYPDLTLRHVGFLGAAPPAVKGLPDVAFKDEDATFIEFDESELSVRLSLIGELFQRIREFFIEKFGKDTADKVISPYNVDWLREPLTEPQKSFAEGGVKLNQKGYSHARELIKQGKIDFKSSWSFSTEDENKILGDPADWDEYAKWFLAVDTSKNKETKAYYKYPFGKNGKVYRSGLIAIRQRAGQQKANDIFDAAGKLLELIEKEEKKMSEELERLKEENERLKQEKQRYEMELTKREIGNFIEGLEKENKIPPVFKEMGIVEFMTALKTEERTIEFSEGQKKDMYAWFKEFLEKLPEVVPLGAQFKDGKADKSNDYELGKKIAEKVN